MDIQPAEIPCGYSYAATAAWFGAGAAVTALFSGSLAPLTKNVGAIEVLLVGMIVPSLTWLIHLMASGIALPERQRRLYWGDLGRVCLIGSVALLPVATANFYSNAPLWLSAANVLLSVVLMAVILFGRCSQHRLARAWPISWCLTIAGNMALFAWVSRGWWL